MDHARSLGCKIRRGPVFEYTKSKDLPVSCNADGAILITLGLHNSIREDFFPNWMDPILKYLSCDFWWWFKFCSGFDYGNELTIIHKKKDKEILEIDQVSRTGNKIAKKFTSYKKP